jgi:hypothetical protein
MSKRNDPVSRARGRKAAPVKKPFPLGFVLGCAALVLFLGFILVYAVQNTSEGDKTSLKYAQKHVAGLKTTKGLKANHVEGAVAYPNQANTPPVGGSHNSVPQSCQAYTAAIANEHAVHSMEHGAVWITYNPDKVSAKDIATLKADLQEDPYRMLSPYPGLKSPISVQAWGEQIFVDKADDKRIKQFLQVFTHGPQLSITKEPNAPCQGTTATGPLAVAPSPTPASSATTPAASPSTSASPK